MTARILDGRVCAEDVRKRVAEEVLTISEKGIRPCLATVLVGDDPASKVYLRKKHEACEKVGILSRSLHMPASSKEEEVFEKIEELNRDPEVHGILVQLPLPEGLSGFRVIERIDPKKDVDGLHPYNAGLATYKMARLLPCTPKGVVTLLKFYGIELKGRDVVIVGRSNLVGKPLWQILSHSDPLELALLGLDGQLLDLDATLTICHSRTRNLKEHTSRADTLIAAVGNRPAFSVTGEMIKEGAVVVDVGMNQIDGKICGDVVFQEAVEKASWITPVPGGVGPMTVATLLENTVLAAKLQRGLA